MLSWLTSFFYLTWLLSIFWYTIHTHVFLSSWFHDSPMVTLLMCSAWSCLDPKTLCGSLRHKFTAIGIKIHIDGWITQICNTAMRINSEVVFLWWQATPHGTVWKTKKLLIVRAQHCVCPCWLDSLAYLDILDAWYLLFRLSFLFRSPMVTLFARQAVQIPRRSFDVGYRNSLQ